MTESIPNIVGPFETHTKSWNRSEKLNYKFATNISEVHQIRIHQKYGNMVALAQVSFAQSTETIYVSKLATAEVYSKDTWVH